jgi:thermitase
MEVVRLQKPVKGDVSLRRYARLVVAFALITVVSFGFCPDNSMATPPGEPAFAPGRILVKVEDKAPANAIRDTNHENGARLEEEIPHSDVSVIDLPSGLSVAEAVERYEASPDVEYAEPDFLLYAQGQPNDPSFSKMYNLENTGQYDGTIDSDIDAPDAWDATTGEPGTTVAVIDSGVDINHPDLRNNIWTNPDEIPGNGVDDDKNNYVDDVHGWDFINNDAGVFDGSGDGHGTHVAGIIAAQGNNGVGVTGINWRAEIMPLKFMYNGKGTVSDAVKALNYAVAEGAKISNNSYGWYDNCSGCFAQTLQDAILEADKSGHLFTAAAGNGFDDYLGDDNDKRPFYPANYDSPNIVSVAATNQEDKLTSFSNYGAKTVDLGAPGKTILSTAPGNGYGYGEGTSMAAPHVAGAAALILSQDPGLDAHTLKARLLEFVDKKTTLEGKLVSGGRLNVAKALGAVAPIITGLHPQSTIRDRSPTIKAMLHSDETELTEAQIGVYLDEHAVQDFSFDQESGRLTARPGKLANGRHMVKVTVQYSRDLEKTRAWWFRIVRHR